MLVAEVEEEEAASRQLVVGISAIRVHVAGDRSRSCPALAKLGPKGPELAETRSVVYGRVHH